ncbi:MAG: PilT/PilU family type 4a pilus ATPase [Gammaproteobacteria bacterium]|nr:PilT/PilU family type 4a pilus ATPase [Gammaproteobacteria bacterium]
MQDYLSDLLRQMRALGASELFLTRGKPPTFRIHGVVTNSNGSPLTHTRLALLTQSLIPQSHINDFDTAQELSFSYRSPTLGRYHVNLFRQQDQYALVVHALAEHIPTLEELGAPEALKKMIKLKRGMMFIAGPAGMGKSTTLASLLNYHNENVASHILTIEDPIEYVLPQRLSIINQREIGRDTANFESAMTCALRQSADIVATSDITHWQTLEYGIRLADAGRLFLSAINANNARHAIERLIGLYPENQQENLLLTLANHTKAVIAQQLVPTLEGGRIAIYELMVVTPRIADLIIRKEFEELSAVIAQGDTNGMQSLDQSLYNLYEQNVISAETALEYASSYRNMRLRMRISNASEATLSL